MEDEKKEELEEETGADDTSHEGQEDESEDESESDEEEGKSEEEDEDIDHEKELEALENGESKNKSKSELDKAARSLYFNALKLKELGGDPAEVLKLKPKDQTTAVGAEGDDKADVSSAIKREFDERDARARAKSEAEFKHIMFYVNKGLSVDDAYILANKGKLARSITEAKRAQVNFGKPDTSARKVQQDKVPARSPAEVAVLERRGLKYNPKTQTYQGRFTEEFFNKETGMWESRKLKR